MEDALLQYLMGMIGPSGVLIFAGIGSLVVVAQTVVTLTPSTADDVAWEKILNIPVLGGLLKAIAKFAPIQKKPKE